MNERLPALTRLLKRLLVPSHSDWLFVALVVWLFVAGAGWSSLLGDGDTGWHIRTGEFVLATGTVPRVDLFSYSKPGAPWFAWEWLADVVYALAWRAAALKGVVLVAGLAIGLSLLLLFRRMLWRGGNLFLALAATLLVAGASGVHYLARPHVFTLLLWTVALWLVDADRKRSTPLLWLLVPLTALWANLHAGFVALVVTLAVLALASLAERDRGRAGRYALVAGGCALASLANPYGLELHRHVLAYLRSDWIRDAVDEFQSPRFRSESAFHFEILLFAGIAAAALLVRRKRIGEAALVLVWAHAALMSVRHVPLFAIVAAPVVVSEATRLWSAWVGEGASRSVRAILDRLASDLAAGASRTSLLPFALVLLLAFGAVPLRWPADFPAQRFPLQLVGRNLPLLSGQRVFTSDQWSDYLIYRFPRQRVFVDGRSDFYGPQIGKLYLRILYGHPEWRDALERYAVEVVLAEKSWPLAHLLRTSSGWRVADEDAAAVLFARAAGFPQPKGISTAGRSMPQEPLIHEYPRSASATHFHAPTHSAPGWASR
ncbi:MAG TPA: hypothetical protein VHA11_07075 [Bryobacteraceae bacterium]|nr:hypothetical protein [Bryobacteraceae bacterium]